MSHQGSGAVPLPSMPPPAPPRLTPTAHPAQPAPPPVPHPFRTPPVAALAATLLLAASAHADAPPAPASSVRPAATRAPKPPPPEPLPDPELTVRVVAPSARGNWTLHLENEGSRWLRVPADIRLLHLSLASSDTTARRPAKPVKCVLPASLQPSGFPERNALLLGPGDSYVEAFDPRLFCFGKEAKAIEGGTLVRAHYGWDLPRRTVKKVDPPFAVEGTTFPAAVEPKKQVVAPALVLSYLPPELDEATDASPKPAPEEVELDSEASPDEVEAHEDVAPPPLPRLAPASSAPPPSPAPPPAPPVPVDENAPRLEVKGSAYADAINGFKVSITVTATNVGHRPATVAILERMVGFRIQGPDGVSHCHAAPPTHALPREAYRVIKPGGSASLTLLVEEACRHPLFRRPGLYEVTPSLHLNEGGAELHLEALTGTVRAATPTLVRVAEGPDPFYRHAPQVVRAPRAEGEAHDGP